MACNLKTNYLISSSSFSSPKIPFLDFGGGREGVKAAPSQTSLSLRATRTRPLSADAAPAPGGRLLPGVTHLECC